MKRIFFFCLSVILTVFALSACTSKDGSSQAHAGESQKKTAITVSAAASLQDALNEIQPIFEKKYPNIKVSFNFGGSGALQQQISQGAPADLFFSAAQDKYDRLVKQGYIQKGEGKDLVGNELVLIVPKDSNKIHSFSDLTKAGKVAVGTPESVPAGQYGKEVLVHDQLWNKLSSKLVYGKDVRQVLTYVETGNVDAGIVYKTDALTSSKVKITASAAPGTHDPIVYPAGIISKTKHHKEAQAFYQFLQTKQAMKIFEKCGFKDLQSK